MSWVAVGGMGASALMGGMGGGGDDGPDFTAAIEGINKSIVQAKEEMKPWTTTGRQANNQLAIQLGLAEGDAYDVTQMAGYQGALEQGLNAVNQGAAGSGMLYSGQRAKDLQSEGQNVYGSYYNDYMNRITGMSNTGLNAAQTYVNANASLRGAQAGLQGQQAQGQYAAQQASQSDMMGALGSMGGMIAGHYSGKGGGGGAAGGAPSSAGGGTFFNTSGNYLTSGMGKY